MRDLQLAALFGRGVVIFSETMIANRNYCYFGLPLYLVAYDCRVLAVLELHFRLFFASLGTSWPPAPSIYATLACLLLSSPSSESPPVPSS